MSYSPWGHNESATTEYGRTIKNNNNDMLGSGYNTSAHTGHQFAIWPVHCSPDTGEDT